MIDPGLKADIRAEKPWTMSPLLCAMNIFNVSNLPGNPNGIIPMIETKNDNRAAVGPDSPISPISMHSLDIKKSLSIDSNGSDDWIYTDGNSLSENSTLLSSGQFMSAESRKVRVNYLILEILFKRKQSEIICILSKSSLWI